MGKNLQAENNVSEKNYAWNEIVVNKKVKGETYIGYPRARRGLEKGKGKMRVKLISM